jgi:isocitrate/isopropylmalate dehydrogenase
MVHRLALLPGDGTGPEVVAQAERVLAAAVERYGLDVATERYDCGAQYYQRTGKEWQEGGLEACKAADGILLGAVGWPGVSLADGNIAGAGVVFGLRFGLDLYANVRPCKLYPGVRHNISGQLMQVWKPELVDCVLVRENTEGLYTPARGWLERGGQVEVAIDNNVITRKGSERVIRYAFELSERRAGAPKDKKKRVTCIDKSNVLRGSQLFRLVYDEVAARHPGIERDYAYVDAFCQWMLRQPESYDVCVATNMMGDIVTDLAAVVQGGMGMAAGGNIGDRHAMFEPIHGSSPKHAGKDAVNPMATVLALSMLLEWVGRRTTDRRMLDAAQGIEAAVAAVCKDGKVLTYDLGGTARCSEVGALVAQRVKQGA